MGFRWVPCEFQVGSGWVLRSGEGGIQGGQWMPLAAWMLGGAWSLEPGAAGCHDLDAFHPVLLLVK